MEILERDLSPEEEKVLRESLETWKEEVYANLLEEVEEAKEKKIEELEEANIDYREELKRVYADKMIVALKEMKEEIRAEVLSEMVETNPEIQIIEQIKEIIAPTLNEEYTENLYANEIQILSEKVRELEEEINLREGAEKLAELIAPYSEQTQNILLAVINEGGPEEVTEQFYEIIESMNLVEADEEDEDEDEDEDEELVKPKKADFDDEKEYEKAMKEYEKAKEEEEDDDDDEDEDDDMDEDYDYEGSYLGEDEEEIKVKNPLRNRILDLVD